MGVGFAVVLSGHCFVCRGGFPGISFLWLWYMVAVVTSLVGALVVWVGLDFGGFGFSWWWWISGCGFVWWVLLGFVALCGVGII